MVRLTLITLALFATLVGLGCGSDDDANVPAGAIAVVDGEEIPKSDFDAIMQNAKNSYEQGDREFPKAGTQEYQSLKNQAVQFLVERKQFALGAEDMDVDVSEEDVDKRIADLKKQLFKGNEKRFQEALKRAGRTEAQLREDIRATILQEEVAEKLTQEIEVTGKDVEKYYRDHLTDYRTPASREVRHILLSVCGGPQADKKTCQPTGEAEQLATQLHGRLENGESFAKLAKQFSDDPGSKATGGKLTVNKGSTVPEFDKTAFELRTGVLSRPVKTDYGYHLIEALSAVKPAKTTPLRQALRSQIRSQLVSQKRSEALTKWVEETKEEYGPKTHYQVGFAPPTTATAATDE
jgi:parvulin-like peptidyl-prolyl isomerase